MPTHFDTIVRELAATRKYRHICPDTINRIASWAASRYPNAKEAVKAAKRKLHQVFAAFLDTGDLGRLLRHVGELPDPSDQEAFLAGCRTLLSEHASTAERLGIMSELYPRLWAEVGRPRVLLDLACGFHPFGWPWFGLGPETEYRPCDIDLRLIEAINLFLGKCGVQPRADARDILSGIPPEPADVALLFKTLTTLEQQDKGVGASVVRAIPARFVVASYPLRSLGGSDKGMRATYERQMSKILAELRFKSKRIDFETEVFYIIEKTST